MSRPEGQTYRETESDVGANFGPRTGGTRACRRESIGGLQILPEIMA
jgi:hypothetical protein